MRAPLLAALLVLAALPHASGEGVAGWRVDLVIDDGRADPDRPFEAFDAASLNVFDFDGDGRKEIVSFNDNNRLYVLDSESGRVLAELATKRQGEEAWEARDINPVAIGDLYGDATPCIVAPNSAAYLTAWCYAGEGFLGRSLTFEKRWEVFVDAAAFEKDFHARHPWIKSNGDPNDDAPGLDGNAFLADVDFDGRMEVFTETDGYPGQFSFSAAGEYRWSRSDWDGNAGVNVADLEGDGKKEAVFASDAGVIACYDARSGKLKWTFDAKQHGATPGSVTLAPTLADLDGDGKKEVVFSARNAVQTADPDWREKSHAVHFALRHDGKVKWRVSHAWMNPLTYNHPAIVDVNGDKVLDVVGLDWNTAGHKPGEWKPTKRPPQLYALDGKDGAALWHASVAAYWSNKDFVVADADGDGRHDVIVNAEENGRDGLAVRDLRSGGAKGFFAIPQGWEVMRGPVASDLRGDGKLWLVLPVAKPNPAPNHRELDVGHRSGALLVIETGVPYDVAFSANLLHTDAPMPEESRGGVGRVVRDVPLAPALAFVALALAVLLRRR